jgi:hypothetical protein
MLTVLKDAARRLCRWQVAILDHRFAFALVGRWSGRRDGQIQSNKGMAPKAFSVSRVLIMTGYPCRWSDVTRSRLLNGNLPDHRLTTNDANWALVAFPDV